MPAISPRDYSLADLQRVTAYSSRMIGRYIQMGLVPAPHGKGSRARYSRDALGRLLFIAALRREDKCGTPEVKREVGGLTDEEIEAWAEEGDPLVAAVDAPPPPVPQISSQHEVVPPAVVPASATVAAVPTLPPGATQRWSRVTLLPGLELMVREGSGELVARLADEIVARYRATGPA